MKKAILAAVILLLFVVPGRTATSGQEEIVNRFTPTGNPWLMFDQKTAQNCFPGSHFGEKMASVKPPTPSWIEGKYLGAPESLGDFVPYCSDLK